MVTVDSEFRFNFILVVTVFMNTVSSLFLLKTFIPFIVCAYCEWFFVCMQTMCLNSAFPRSPVADFKPSAGMWHCDQK